MDGRVVTIEADAAPSGRARFLREHAVLLVLAAFFLVRLPLLGSFLTHVDDVGLIWDVASGEDQGIVSQVERVRHWTYAPAQFLPLALVLRLASDHEGLLFWGRLPSLIAWFLGLVAAHRLFRATYPERPWIADLLVAIQGVSWRGLIESSQSYNYAATSFVAVAVLALFLREARELQGSPRPLASLPRLELAGVLASGLALGCLSWITYQGLFLTAGGFLALGGLMVAHRRWDALLRLTALGVLAAWPVDLVHRFHLQHVAARGIAGWIPPSMATPAGPLEAPGFLLARWFEVVENDVTFLPWGAGSAALATLVLAGVLAGARRRSSQGAQQRSLADRRIVAVLLGVVLVFSAGPLLAVFPLSCTRHTYVLQVPILLALGLGLDRAGLSRRLSVALTSTVLVAGCASAAYLYSRTTVKLDLARLESIAAADSQLAVMSFGEANTRDHLLLLRAHPEWKGRLVEGQPRPPELPPRLVVISHRAPLTSEELTKLRELGYEAPTTIQDVAPTGFTELRGDLNGGNGAYVVLLRRIR